MLFCRWKTIARIERRRPPSCTSRRLDEADNVRLPSAQHQGGVSLMLRRWNLASAAPASSRSSRAAMCRATRVVAVSTDFAVSPSELANRGKRAPSDSADRHPYAPDLNSAKIHKNSLRHLPSTPQHDASNEQPTANHRKRCRFRHAHAGAGARRETIRPP